MEYSKFRDFVVEFIVQAAASRGKKIEVVDDKQDLIEAGLVDSHTFIDLCLAIEERSGAFIDIPSLEPAEFSSIRGLYTIVTGPHA